MHHLVFFFTCHDANYLIFGGYNGNDLYPYYFNIPSANIIIFGRYKNISNCALVFYFSLLGTPIFLLLMTMFIILDPVCAESGGA